MPESLYGGTNYLSQGKCQIGLNAGGIILDQNSSMAFKQMWSTILHEMWYVMFDGSFACCTDDATAMLTVRSVSGAKNGWKMSGTMGSILGLRFLRWRGEHSNCLVSGSIRTTPTLASRSRAMFLLDGDIESENSG